MNHDDLYRIWKAEKSEKTLQRLPPSFYAEVARLLSDSKAAVDATGQDPTHRAISEKELQILKRLATEVAETRMKKIAEAALSRLDIPLEMLSREEAEFSKLVATHTAEHYRFIDELGQGAAAVKKARSQPAEIRLEVVRFLSDFPAIIGVDLKTYGPFKAEDIATLPAENASVLINQRVVKQVEYSEGLASVA